MKGTATKFVFTIIITVMVISSPILMLVNPPAAVVAADTAVPTDITTGAMEAAAAPTTPSTLSQDGSDFTIQAALTSPSSKQTNNIVNTQSEFAVTFTTATTGVIKKVIVTFPVGTNIGSVNLLITREGIGPGTATKTSSTTITYTVDNAVSVPAGTKIKLEFGTIVNSPNPGNSFVTVQTRTAANTIIDGPTSIGFNLKQIGTDDMADNSITSTKPAESFMKRVTVADDAAGHAVGWNPGAAATTEFTISEPDVSGQNTALISIEVVSSVNHFCDVTSHSGVAQSFTIDCSSAPTEGTTLHYLVQNLPAHVVQ